MAVDGQGYDIPILSYDELVKVVQQDGLFGEEAKQLTMEHLKSPSPAFVAQICISMLQKLEVNVENISQAHLQSSMSVKYPNTLNHMYRYIHLVELTANTLPQYNLKRFSLVDIMNPTWPRLQKVLSAYVNFYRSVEDSNKDFQGIISKYKDGIHEKENLENDVELKRNKIAELRADRSENEAMLQQIQKELEETSHFLEIENSVIKSQKNAKKAKIKSVLQERANTLEKKQSELDALQQEKTRLSSLIVGSPKRFMKEQELLKAKLQSVEQVCFDLQDKGRKAQKMMQDAQTQHKLLTDIIKMGNAAIDRNKRKGGHEMEIQSTQNEVLSLEIANQGMLQDINSFKQQIVSAEQKISRCSLRWKSKAEVLKSTLNQLTRERDIQESQGHEISKELNEVGKEVGKFKEELKSVEEEHQIIMDLLESKEQQIMLAVDKYHTHIMGQVSKSKN